MTMTMTKLQLIEALEAKRPLCVAYDKRVTAKHKQDEQEFLKKWRAALKEAGKWTYEEAKQRDWSNGVNRILFPNNRSWGNGAPRCPESKVASLDLLLRGLRAYPDGKKFIIGPNGNSYLHRYWLMLNWFDDQEQIKDTVC